jgi:23S rRNA pseudouridine955/2504/2580 synthase
MSWKRMPKEKSRKGVHTVSVDADRDGQRVDNFLSARLKGVPRSAVYRLIRTGQVRINGSRCKPATRLSTGDEVRIPPVRSADRDQVIVSDAVKAQVNDAIVLETDDVLVVNKPSGMAVHSGSGLPWGLIDVLRQLRPGAYIELVHRLDRETSGCLVLAKSGSALNHLSAQFREGKAEKFYLCLLNGIMAEDRVEVDAPLARVAGEQIRQVEVAAHGKPAKTRFLMLHRYRDCSYVEAELLSGRTHQIRVHAQHLGMALAGDQKYGSREQIKQWRERGLRRLFLHAHRISLDNPAGGDIDVELPLPAELRSVIDSLQ